MQGGAAEEHQEGGEALLRVALAGGGVEEDNDDGQTDVANEGEDVPKVQVGVVACVFYIIKTGMRNIKAF